MAKPKKPPAPPPLTENEVQKAVFKHLRTRGAPGVFAFHPKNGGVHHRGRARGINAGLGVVSGVPDIVVCKLLEWNASPEARARFGQFYCLELKRTPKDIPSDEQFAVLARLEACGAICGVAYGLDDAIHWLEGNGLLKGRAG
jgi:hypothetical protein